MWATPEKLPPALGQQTKAPESQCDEQRLTRKEKVHRTRRRRVLRQREVHIRTIKKVRRNYRLGDMRQCPKLSWSQFCEINLLRLELAPVQFIFKNVLFRTFSFDSLSKFAMSTNPIGSFPKTEAPPPPTPISAGMIPMGIVRQILAYIDSSNWLCHF